MRQVIVNVKGVISRVWAEDAPRRYQSKTWRRCPYCWDAHRERSIFCCPEHAGRFHQHNANVRASRIRFMDALLRRIKRAA